MKSFRLRFISLAAFLLCTSVSLRASVNAVAAAAPDEGVAITSYVLHIIDRSGNEVNGLTTTIAASALTDDPLPKTLRSPFATDYRYFTTAEAAKTNSTDGALSSTSDWPTTGDAETMDIYVGYNVSSDFTAKAWSIRTSSLWMHAVWNITNSAQSYTGYGTILQNQNYDASSDKDYDKDYVYNGVKPENTPLIDDNYLWQFDSDPYKTYVKSKTVSKYLYTNDGSDTWFNAGNIQYFSILYGAEDGSYCVLRLADNANDKYVKAHKHQSNWDWRQATTIDDNCKLYIEDLPTVTVNVVNPESKVVEYSFVAHHYADGKLTYIPYYLKREYTSDWEFYYSQADAANHENAISRTTPATLNSISDNNIFLGYTLDSKWNSEDLFLTSTADGTKNWYSIKIGKNSSKPYLYVNNSGTVVPTTTEPSQTTVDERFAFIGSPYCLQIVSALETMNGKVMGAKTGDLSKAQMLSTADAGYKYWEMPIIVKENQVSGTWKPYPSFRLQGALNGESPFRLLRSNDSSLNDADNDFCRISEFIKYKSALFTLQIVDKSGNEVDGLTQSVTEWSADPLDKTLRSPFATSYHYYLSRDDAQANNTENALGTDQSAWTGSTIYVGYDVSDAFKGTDGEGKAWSIRTADRWMHVVWSLGNSHNSYPGRQYENASSVHDQKYDAASNKADYVCSDVSPANTPLIDDNFLWQLGDDPYRVCLKDNTLGRYAEIKNSANRSVFYSLANQSTPPQYFSILNGPTTSTDDAYCVMRLVQEDDAYINSVTSDDDDWRQSTTIQNTCHLYIEDLPTVTVDVVNPESKEVEYSFIARHYADGKLTYIPYYLKRQYTKDWTFYSDKALTAPIACDGSVALGDDNMATVDEAKHVYFSYTLDEKWNSESLFLTSSLTGSSADLHWYSVKMGGQNQYLTVNTSTHNVVGTTTAPGDNDDQYYWAFIGSPYSLRVINLYEQEAGNDFFLGYDGSDNEHAKMIASAAGNNTVWEVPVITTNTVDKSFDSALDESPSLRLQGALNGQSAFWMIRANGTYTLNDADNNTCRIATLTPFVRIYTTWHVRDNASLQEATFTNVIVNDGAAANVLPRELRRLGTTNLQFYKDGFGSEGTALTAADKISEELKEVYVTYDIDYTTDGHIPTDMFWKQYDADMDWFVMYKQSSTDSYQAYWNHDNGYALTHSPVSTSTAPVTNDNYQWAFVGTPYSFRIVNQRGGGSRFLASPNAENGPDYQGGTQLVVTDDLTSYPYYEWELVSATIDNVSTSGGLVAIRLKGTGKYLYLGYYRNPQLSSTARTVNITELPMITFKIYGPDGSYTRDVRVSPTVGQKLKLNAAYDDISSETDYAALSAEVMRRYTKITAISDQADFSTDLTSSDIWTVGSAEAQTVYLKWEYTDDAPVFSKGTDPRNWQYYIFRDKERSKRYEVVITKDGDNVTKAFSEDDNLESIKSYTHQFAFVGNPYAFHIYSRSAGQYMYSGSEEITDISHYDSEAWLGANSSNGLSCVELTDATLFDLPAAHEGKTDFVYNSFTLRQANTEKFFFGTWFNDGARNAGHLQFLDIIIPIRVFKKGSTQLVQRKDYREYALKLPDTYTDRITDDMLKNTGTVGNSHDFRHAFCNYEYYFSYDWESGTLSNPIPTTGSDKGLPFCGGTEQYKRAFFATYTVDEAQFGQEWLIAYQTGNIPQYFGKGRASEHSKGFIISDTKDLTTARNDDSGTYRWVFTGDPYDLKIHNLGIGNDFAGYAFGSKELYDDMDLTPTDENGMLALIAQDDCSSPASEQYGIYNRWEIIARSDGEYIFFCVNDHVERYTHGIGQKGYLSDVLTVNTIDYGNSLKEHEMLLIPAVLQHNLTWQMVSPDGTLMEEKYVQEHVTEGNYYTIYDMPEVLKRHFCDYTAYSSSDCSEASLLPDEGLKITSTDAIIYIKWTYHEGSPRFYSSVSDIPATDGEDYNIRFRGTNGTGQNQQQYLYDTSETAGTAGTLAYSTEKNSHETGTLGEWFLIGTPYDVQFYNQHTHNFITIPTDIWPGADITTATESSDEWSHFLLLDDITGERAAICRKEAGGMRLIYIGKDGKLAIHNDTEDADGAEFVGNKGVDGLTLVLHLHSQSLRPLENDEDGVDASARTITVSLDTWQELGKRLDRVMPDELKRAFCSYTYKWKKDATTDTTVHTAIDEALSAASAENMHIKLDVFYTVDPTIAWSTEPTEDTKTNGKYDGLRRYHLVNNHRQGINSGYMLYEGGDHTVRANADFLPSWIYAFNYQWGIIGDPYGFKVIGAYVCDGIYDEYLGVDPSTQNLVAAGSADTRLFEMRTTTRGNFFWMHPVFTKALRAETSTDISYVGVGIGQPQVYTHGIATSIAKSGTAIYRLEPVSEGTLVEYIRYAGFVGGLKNSVVDGEPTLKALQEKLNNGETIELTADEARMIREKLYDPENIVHMTQGYYRIISHAYEKGHETLTPQRVYLRGYLYGDGVSAYYGEHAPDYTARQEVNTDGTPLKGLHINETKADAMYDPASIFYFESKTEDGKQRYIVRSQGRVLAANGQLVQPTADDNLCRYENLGAAMMQLRLHEINEDNPNERNYLSYVQNFGGHEADDTRRASTRQAFEMYGGTRFYLQPIGEDNNEMPLKLKLNSAFGGASYASIYAPYDLTIDPESDAIAFIATSLVADNSGSNGGRDILKCVTLDYFDETYGEKFIPAHTPVVIRSDNGEEEITFTRLNTAPTENSDIAAANLIGGYYISQVNQEPKLFTFGRELVYNGYTGEVVEDKYTGRVGFFRRIDVKKPLLPNKVYYITQNIPQSDAKEGVVFDFSTRTTTFVNGISQDGTPAWNTTNAAVYDLQGRKIADSMEAFRASGTCQRGVYIVGGKKVIIK